MVVQANPMRLLRMGGRIGGWTDTEAIGQDRPRQSPPGREGFATQPSPSKRRFRKEHSSGLCPTGSGMING